MYKIRPEYFFDLGFRTYSLHYLAFNPSITVAATILQRASEAIAEFLEEPSVAEMLPASVSRAVMLSEEINRIVGLQLWPMGTFERVVVEGQAFCTTIMNELNGQHSFTVTAKSPLSVDCLIEGISKTYPPHVVALFDKWMCDEIDAAGKCLACEMCTASGFHILRAVEIGIKALVHAVTGSLPRINKRTWGEYIDVLKKTNISLDFVDVISVLKNKRNPLMHPTNQMDVSEAIDVLCLCRAALILMVDHIRNNPGLDAKFIASLAAIPEL